MEDLRNRFVRFKTARSSEILVNLRNIRTITPRGNKTEFWFDYDKYIIVQESIEEVVTKIAAEKAYG